MNSSVLQSTDAILNPHSSAKNRIEFGGGGGGEVRFADLRHGGCLLIPFRLRTSLLSGVEARDSAHQQGR